MFPEPTSAVSSHMFCLSGEPFSRAIRLDGVKLFFATKRYFLFRFRFRSGQRHFELMRKAFLSVYGQSNFVFCSFDSKK